MKKLRTFFVKNVEKVTKNVNNAFFMKIIKNVKI